MMQASYSWVAGKVREETLKRDLGLEKGSGLLLQRYRDCAKFLSCLRSNIGNFRLIKVTITAQSWAENKAIQSPIKPQKPSLAIPVHFLMQEINLPQKPKALREEVAFYFRSIGIAHGWGRSFSAARITPIHLLQLPFERTPNGLVVHSKLPQRNNIPLSMLNVIFHPKWTGTGFQLCMLFVFASHFKWIFPYGKIARIRGENIIFTTHLIVEKSFPKVT